ncbi:MAG: shikimate dehydrogenase [Candidatus Bathyarchaeota archaeon]|nr:shikimate dehydrogenase [Candidatus Bathyarchaeota archaeon]MDP7207105.1 shikimate dehydrogenase [Candidatus Bathyarchaeota archaeon]MDP7442887.1 shikimate dehydrogenase [Candidatus Bathyarchaeota archaeon]
MKVCFLLGYPVSHSMSAVMHNAAFQELELDYRYKLKSVPPDELGALVASELRRNEYAGGSITIPHKLAIMEHLNGIDSSALRIGAVNTIVNEDGWLKGYNTDGIGALRGITEVYGNVKDARVVIAGAGGAARAVGYQLSTVVQELTITNRTMDRAEELAVSLSANPECRGTVRSIPFERDSLRVAIEDADILVNGTPLGMHPKTDETPIPIEVLHPDLLVFDLVYNPIRTRLLREAERVGAAILSGVNMLVYQGVVAFKMWTGIDPPVETMKTAVLGALGGE